ncbi:hypothetical protein D3C76_778380 [compost metagenome]
MLDKSGTTVMATKREKRSEITIVQASGTKNFPIIPGTKASGKKTATVVIVDEVIAPATSLVAFSMRLPSRLLSLLILTRRKMFSMTTMESSTTRPTATAIAARVSVFKV